MDKIKRKEKSNNHIYKSYHKKMDKVFDVIYGKSEEDENDEIAKEGENEIEKKEKETNKVKDNENVKIVDPNELFERLIIENGEKRKNDIRSSIKYIDGLKNKPINYYVSPELRYRINTIEKKKEEEELNKEVEKYMKNLSRMRKSNVLKRKNIITFPSNKDINIEEIDNHDLNNSVNENNELSVCKEVNDEFEEDEFEKDVNVEVNKAEVNVEVSKTEVNEEINDEFEKEDVNVISKEIKKEIIQTENDEDIEFNENEFDTL